MLRSAVVRFRSPTVFALGALLAGSAVLVMGCEVPSVQFAADDAADDAISSGLLPGDLAESGAVRGMDATAAPDAGNTGDAPTEQAASDADADADANAADAAVGASPDAAPYVDAATGEMPEASAPPSMCPGVVPAGAIACCADVPCVAPNTKKCAEACATCEKSCAGATCCLHPNGSFAACRPSPADCPSM